MVVVMSWNVRGIMSSTLCLSYLLNKYHCDISVVSEHKLKENCTSYLDSIHPSFYSFSKTDSNVMSKTVHNTYFIGKGGIAILVRKQLQYSIQEIPCLESQRIIGIHLRQGCNSFYIYGV